MHHDALGSVTVVSITSGNSVQVAYRSTYKAFGPMTRTGWCCGYSMPTTRLGFTGREISTGSLMNYRKRYYDTNSGRFIQSDPYSGDVILPCSLHHYTYVYDNPARLTDPNGEFPSTAAACPGGAWILTGWSVGAFGGGIGFEIGWAQYKCTSGTGPRCEGWTMAAPLVGVGTDISVSANLGAVIGAYDATAIEGPFGGFDINFSAGLGIGFGLWWTPDFRTWMWYISPGYGYGFHWAGGTSYTFDLDCY